jgi:uncharacterized repeat protein (TIGR03803 family)
MKSESKTGTIGSVNSDLTKCRRWLLAPAAMLAILMTFAVSAIARADESGASTEQLPPIPVTLIYTFGMLGGTGCANLDGADPKGSLTFANGLLFGSTSSTTAKGNGNGIIFHIDPAGTNYSIDHLFTGGVDGNDPENNAMTLNGSVLYGTTLLGGDNRSGTIFRINDDGTEYSSLPLFAGSGVKNKGNQPFSTFALSNGVLFGMTSLGGSKHTPIGDGTIFSFDPQTTNYTVIHSFNRTIGSDPHGRPIIDPTGTTLYGMTQTGGLHKVGIIFSLNPATCGGNVCARKFVDLHNFNCPHQLTPTCVDPHDGASPDHGTLVQSGTKLFGMTTAGGQFGMGTIFSLALTGTKHFKVLHSFGASPIDGQNPLGSLMLNGSTLYGTTNRGGKAGLGTVFQIDTNGKNYMHLHDFQGGNSDGANPSDDVILVGNTLYGMTEAGGKCGHGVIFSIALQ